MEQSKKLRLLPVSLVSAAAAIVFCSAFAQAGWLGWHATKASAEMPSAPFFALKNLSGTVVRPADFLGKPVLIDFWASWCSSCKTALPFYQSLYAKHRDQGLVVLGINEGDPGKTAAQAAESEGVSYPVLLDPRGKVLYAYGVRGLPTVVLLDRKGRIQGRWFGFNPTDSAAMTAKVAALLKKKSRPADNPQH